MTASASGDTGPGPHPFSTWSTAHSTYAPDVPIVEAMSALLARNWWAIALRGVVAILFGLMALAMPVAVMLSMALLFAAYLSVDGVFAIVAAVRAAQAHERWGLLIVEGILNIVMGVIAAAFPVGAVLAFVFVTAGWALITGGLMLAAAFHLGQRHGRFWLGLGGALSIIWGVLLVIAPLAGAVVLTWWIGAYALVFGVVLLILGFQLRRHRSDAGTVTGLPPNRAPF
jgi:uncharacterized membrane protein HdeD (DUF308 family)